ncbi:MAG TPA: hypothetical protein VEV13_07250 [Candidatus Limnocylindria bacterium]|nr:hypothetical protein [Candidatus Limnocylindria bacterium]
MGLVSQVGDRFGAAVATANLNSDGCAAPVSVAGGPLELRLIVGALDSSKAQVL